MRELKKAHLGELRRTLTPSQMKNLYLKGLSLAEIARRAGVSRERVRQIVKREGVTMPGGTPRVQKHCIIEGCKRAYKSSGYCSMHYTRVKIHNDPLYERPFRPHGTYASFRRGCQCALCVSALKIYRQANSVNRRKKGLSSSDPRHGTYNGYNNYGCMCERCKAAGAKYNNLKKKERKRASSV